MIFVPAGNVEAPPKWGSDRVTRRSTPAARSKILLGKVIAWD